MTTQSLVPDLSMTALMRPSVVCPHCYLTQFRTASGGCRRCKLNVDDLTAGKPAAAALPEPQKLQRWTDRGPYEQCGGWIEHVMPVAIRFLRERAKLSQRDVALKLGLPRTFLSKMENGHSCPTILSLDRLAAVLETDAAHVILLCEHIWQACMTPAAPDFIEGEQCLT